MESFESIHAHFKGPVKIALNKDPNSRMNLRDNLFISVGTDTSLFYWSLDSNGKLQYREEICTEDNLSCIAWWNKNVYLGQTSNDPITDNEQNRVSLVEYGKTIVNGTISEFSFETCALDCSEDGKYVVAASNDFTIKSIQLDDKYGVLKYDKYCTDDPILSIAINPKGIYFAVAFSNSTVNIYKLNAEKDICGQQKLEPVAKFSFSNKQYLSKGGVSYSMTWSRNGEFLYLPSDNGVKVITYMVATNKFVEDGKWSSDKGENFNNCSVSSANDRLAVSSVEGTIIVFDTNNGRVISEPCKPTTGISSFAWSPLEEHENVLIVCDVDQKTYLYTVKIIDVFGSEKANVVLKRKILVSDDEEEEVEKMDFNDNDDATNVSCDLGKIKNSCTLPVNDEMEEEEEEVKYVPERVVKYKPPKILPPFVVASTPTTNVGCFLKWNNHGIISLIRHEDESHIEAAFHDISVHGEIIVDNTDNNFTMGDISNKALVLASPKHGKKSSSRLFVKYFASWDSNSRDWEVTFDDSDESIVNVALADSYIAVATNYKYIRVYTLAGMQINVFCYNGPLVTMIANDDILSVVRYDGGAMFTGEKDDKGSFCVDYPLKMDFHFMSTVKCVKSFPVTLTPYSNLQFITFTPDSDILTMDSKFNFFVFHMASATWLPVKSGSDLLTHDLDSIFPVFVTLSSTYQIRYIYVANAQYPLVTHKNPLQAADIEFPLLEKSSDRYALENQLLLSKYFPATKFTLNGTTTTKAGILLRLFALATTTKRMVRATDVAKMADEEKIIQALSNYAGKQNCALLSEKVNEIGREMMRKRENKNEKKNVEFADDFEDDEKISFNNGGATPMSKISTPTVIVVPKRKFPKTPFNGGRNKNNSSDINLSHSFLEDEGGAFMEKEDYNLTQKSVNSELPSMGRLFSANPFKKDVGLKHGGSQTSTATNSGDFFDSLTASRAVTPPHVLKRKAEALSSNTTLNVLKQAKLSFASTPITKPSSSYEYWKLKNDKQLREQYKGGENSEEGFIRFVAQKYRSLSDEERSKWAKEYEESEIV